MVNARFLHCGVRILEVGTQGKSTHGESVLSHETVDVVVTVTFSDRDLWSDFDIRRTGPTRICSSVRGASSTAVPLVCSQSFWVRFNPKGAVASKFPFHVMVQNAIAQKSTSAREMSKISQGEV